MAQAGRQDTFVFQTVTSADLSETLCQLLRDWKEKEGMTNGTLAEALHVRQSLVAGWLSGNTTMSAYHVFKVIEKLGGKFFIEMPKENPKVCESLKKFPKLKTLDFF